MLSPDEPRVRWLDVRKSTRQANFSQIIPHYAKPRSLCASWLICDTRYGLATKPPALCRTGAIDWLRDFYVPLLNGIRTAAGAGGAMLALLKFEGQHVQQAVDAICQRLEQCLLFERRDVEMKAQEID
jgi:hypothetical protein